jgi:Family of unknown function (DUF6448)
MRFASIALVIGLTAAASPLFAHCDSMKGPVVTAAQQALEKGDVTSVLKWVPASKEAEIRDAFAKTIAARKASPQAREVADRWFFETLVRVHRESEGESFTGLKGADFRPEEGIELADEAIASGSISAAEKLLVDNVRDGLRKRFAEVVEAKDHASESVEAGRHYVHAYVEFIHYVERLHESATTTAGQHTAH